MTGQEPGLHDFEEGSVHPQGDEDAGSSCSSNYVITEQVPELCCLRSLQGGADLKEKAAMAWRLLGHRGSR